jgi:hypothetical protein
MGTRYIEAYLPSRAVLVGLGFHVYGYGALEMRVYKKKQAYEKYVKHESRVKDSLLGLPDAGAQRNRIG